MEKILDRVRKLLALANDDAATEGERDNALRMAHNTLMKYELSMEDVDQHQREKEDPRGRFDTEGWNLVWCRQVRGAVARMFFCRYVIGGKINATRGKHIWIGRASATTTAAYMSDWVIKSLLKEADSRYKHRLTPEGRAFCVGAADKLGERVADILKASQQQVKEAGSALVVADLARTENEANQNWLNENLRTKKSNITSRRRVDSDAYHGGREFGGSINLNKQVATTATPRQIK
jgi:hypothetical protein